MTDNPDRYMMEDKVIGFARGVEKKNIVVAQIGAKPVHEQAETMDEDRDEDQNEDRTGEDRGGEDYTGEDVENDMEVDEIEPEYNELEAINAFLKTNNMNPNNPSEVLAKVRLHNIFIP